MVKAVMPTNTAMLIKSVKPMKAVKAVSSITTVTPMKAVKSLKSITRRRLSLFIAAIMLLACVFAVSAAAETYTNRVIDNANLLTDSERSAIEAQIASLRADTGMDFVFLTDTELEYNEDYYTAESAATAHAEDFYDYNSFGENSSDRAGIIYYLDMTNRIPIIITTGRMIDIIDDSRLNNLFDLAYDKLGSGDYAGSAEAVFKQTGKYISSGIAEGQYRYDTETGEILTTPYNKLTIAEFIVALLVGLGLGGIYYAVVKHGYSLKGSTYRFDLSTGSKCKITETSDVFLRETVTRTPRAQQSNYGGGGGGGHGSGTHMGSSSTSHGGGGGGHRF